MYYAATEPPPPSTGFGYRRRCRRRNSPPQPYAVGEPVTRCNHTHTQSGQVLPPNPSPPTRYSSRTRTPPPPSLTSTIHTRTHEEIKALGSLASRSRRWLSALDRPLLLLLLLHFGHLRFQHVPMRRYRFYALSQQIFCAYQPRTQEGEGLDLIPIITFKIRFTNFYFFSNTLNGHKNRFFHTHCTIYTV